jgi:sporulation protein YlmC with PRC-barrel domain
MKKYTVLTAVTALAWLISSTPALADSNVGGGMPSPDKVPQDKRTDLTGGQKGIPDEYANTPVRQGSLKEIKDSKWLNHLVTNKKGEKLGKVAKVLMDEKTQMIEYVIIEVADMPYARPMLWSRFEERKDKLILNATKDELLPSVSQKDSKDRSPDLAAFMDEIEKKRAEPKPKVGPGDGRGTDRSVPSTGAFGEDSAAGNLGPRGVPAGEAPGYEGEGKKLTR